MNDQTSNKINLLIEHDSALIEPINIEGEMINTLHFDSLKSILSKVYGISKILFDLRGATGLYEDIKDILTMPTTITTQNILVSSEDMLHEISRNKSALDVSKIAITKEDLKIKTKEFMLNKIDGLSEEVSLIYDELDYYGNIKKYLQSRKAIEKKPHLENRSMALKGFLDDYSQNSLMGLFAIFFDDVKRFKIRPYHCYSAYELELESEILVTRPAILAHRTRTFLIDEVFDFEHLINKPDVKEGELQYFFEQHPHFFRGVNQNLCKVYPQVFLYRNQAKSLKPDFILEPMDEKWCELLDIKLPTVKLVTGPENRSRLSSAVLEGISQLKEYQRYFENPKNRELFKEIMYSKGARDDIDSYFPRLTLIIGMFPDKLQEDAIRRQLMTMYSDIKILTYDQLLKHALNNLLI